MATEREYQLTAEWNGASLVVTVKAKAKPLMRAATLADLLGSQVEVWLLGDGVKYLVHETRRKTAA